MIRAAEHSDTKAIVALLQAVYRASIYVDFGGVDVQKATDLCTNMIHLMGNKGDTSSLVWAAVDDSGVVNGLIMGMRQPVYHIGTKQVAQEVFFVGDKESVSPQDMIALYRRFLTWADQPGVIEIKASTTDVFRWQDWRTLRPFYEARGFVLSGEVFVRRIQR